MKQRYQGFTSNAKFNQYALIAEIAKAPGLLVIFSQGITLTTHFLHQQQQGFLFKIIHFIRLKNEIG